ncbi:hypothetical protein DID96_03300 [Burkholderia sp. Bp8963]|nr:hypothetical protein DID96_03300 [Burkholderia sp. Bp8963]
MADASAIASGIAFCATCNGAAIGAMLSDCPPASAVGVVSCASAYVPQQHANAAAASKVAR